MRISGDNTKARKCAKSIEKMSSSMSNSDGEGEDENSRNDSTEHCQEEQVLGLNPSGNDETEAENESTKEKFNKRTKSNKKGQKSLQELQSKRVDTPSKSKKPKKINDNNDSDYDDDKVRLRPNLGSLRVINLELQLSL